MVRAWTLLSCFVAAICSHAQSGGPFCSVPAGGAPMPHYFYSTNNHVSGNAMVGPADERGSRYFVYACLKVGGYIVDEYIHILGEPQPMSIGGEATFDSTVFGNGSSLLFASRQSTATESSMRPRTPLRSRTRSASLKSTSGTAT